MQIIIVSYFLLTYYSFKMYSFRFRIAKYRSTVSLFSNNDILSEDKLNSIFLSQVFQENNLQLPQLHEADKTADFDEVRQELIGVQNYEKVIFNKRSNGVNNLVEKPTKLSFKIPVEIIYKNQIMFGI